MKSHLMTFTCMNIPTWWRKMTALEFGVFEFSVVIVSFLHPELTFTFIERPSAVWYITIVSSYIHKHALKLLVVCTQNINWCWVEEPAWCSDSCVCTIQHFTAVHSSHPFPSLSLSLWLSVYRRWGSCRLRRSLSSWQLGRCVMQLCVGAARIHLLHWVIYDCVMQPH